eukprot:Pgem_evm5s18099
MSDIIENNRNDFIEKSLEKSLDKVNPIIEFNVNELCFIRNKVYDTGNDTSKKFQIRFEGPFEIVEQVDDTTYKVKNIVSGSILTKNVDDIKKFKLRVENNDYKTLSNLPLKGDSHGWDTVDLDEIEIKQIIDSRFERDGKNVPFIAYKVETNDGITFWEDERRLNCSALITDFNAKRQHEQDIERTLYRNKRTRKAI